MKKSLSLVLLLTVSFPILAAAEENDLRKSTYQLKTDAAETYRLKEASTAEMLNTEELQDSSNEASSEQQSAKSVPEIQREDIEDGFIEKLIDTDGKIIAEKTVQNGEVVKRVLNYYGPSGALSRKVTALNDDAGFYAEEYYPNGAIASQVTYLNEQNKIGKEKKYDITGTLRQEIEWSLAPDDENTPKDKRHTVRTGNIITYYPNGQVAAVFPADNKGTAIFYNRYGKSIKTIKDSKILNFAQELSPEDCIGTSISLSLEDLIELYEDEGDVSYNKCGLPYRENFIYEVTDTRGNIASKISYDTTGMIRRITAYANGQKNGLEQKYDASGNLIAEVNYKDGQKDGMATGYFPTREKAFSKRYENGKVEGTMSCYFPNGELAAEFLYKDGKKQKGKIYSPTAREIDFSKDGELLTEAPQISRRKIVSNLSLLKTPDKKCLNLDEKIESLNLDIEAGANTIMKSFTIEIPEECTNMETFFPEKSQFVCYDKENHLRAMFPIDYNRGAYAQETVYTKDNKPLYDISFLKKKRQGWTKKYDASKKVIAEIYFDQGNLASSSRSYHENGAVNEILEIADNAPRKLVARYGANGDLEFSLSYNKGNRLQAFVAEPEKNKEIYITYYEDKIDNIREVNAKNPQNFIEYNLALGEYTVYRDEELIKGGKICGYEEISPEIDVIMLNKEEGEEIEPTAEKNLPAPAKDSASSALSEQEEAPAPLLKASEAPLVEDIKPIRFDDTKFENAVIPTEEDKRQAELAALNIGPVAKPDIKELADAVTKQSVEKDSTERKDTPAKTEKFYYPNGALRKTVKARGSRTEEIKEYSKTGLLLTDTVYNDKDIIIEKYSGSGNIRRKTAKNYDDNSVTAFISRNDFYDNGTPRYEISRTPETLLFSEKSFAPDGSLKETTVQTLPLAFINKQYDAKQNLIKETEKQGTNVLVKEYQDKKLVNFTLNGKKMPETLADNSAELLKDNTKTYTKKGAIASEFLIKENQNALIEYYPNKKIKTEIIFYNNGEISVKSYNKSGTLEKFAYLAPNGKLYIQKPEVRVIPGYRERWWVDYNNPNWVENQDKYSINSIARLNLDTAARILAELEADVPETLKKLYEVY